MDEYTFKHCPKGHYYQGDECPYCKAQSTPLNEISRLDISWTQHTHRGSYGTGFQAYQTLIIKAK